jgi:ABC-type iron transport system FetAB ATPase subunit
MRKGLMPPWKLKDQEKDLMRAFRARLQEVSKDRRCVTPHGTDSTGGECQRLLDL